MMIPILFAFTVCGFLNWGYAWLLALAVLFVGVPARRREPVRVSFLLKPGFWFPAVFGWLYATLAGAGFSDFQYYFFLPLMAYAAGWLAFEETGGVRDCILGMALGFGIYAGLNLSVNLGHARYQLMDFWSGEFRTATGSGSLNTMLVSIPVYTLFLEERKRMKGLLLAVTTICVMYMLMLGTRTQVVILILVPAVSGLLLIWERRYTADCVRPVWIGLFFVAAVVTVYQLDLFGLREFVGTSNLIARFMDGSGLRESNSERLKLITDGISNLLQHPLGGQKLRYYFHNLWLDIGRVAGVVPLAVMLGWNLFTAVHIFRIFKDQDIPAATRYLLLCVSMGMGMNFMVEPVLEGMLNFYLAFCALNGMTDGLYYSRRNGRLP